MSKQMGCVVSWGLVDHKPLKCKVLCIQKHVAKVTEFFTCFVTFSELYRPCERKKQNEVTQSCPILYDPMDYSPSGSSVHGIFQARELEWVAISFFKGSS